MTKNLLGEIVKMTREKNSWSQETLAEISGIAVRTIQRLEAGDKAGAETIIALANALKSDFETFNQLNFLVSSEAYEGYLDQTKKEAEELEKKLSVLLCVDNSKELLDVVSSFMVLHTDYPPPESEEEAKAIGDLMQSVKDFGDLHSELEPSQRLEVIYAVQREFEVLTKQGFRVFAGKLKGSIKFHGESTSNNSPLRMNLGMVAIRRAKDPRIFKNRNQNKDSIAVVIPYGEPVSLC